MQTVAREMFVHDMARHLVRGRNLGQSFMFCRVKGAPDRFQTGDAMALQGTAESAEDHGDAFLETLEG